ncbi:MAG: ATP-binding protein [bacterium]
MVYPRTLQQKIEANLKGEEILFISGPRQAGKTTLLHTVEAGLKNQGQTVFFLDLEDPDYLGLLNQSPKNLFQLFHFDFKKISYLLIDEIQYLKNPSNFLKYFFDTYKGKIKFIVSGSSAFYLDQRFKDSLAGRKKLFTLLTLSLREFLVFKGEAALAGEDFSKTTLPKKEKVERYYSEYLIYGGYPKVVLASYGEKESVLKDLAQAYIKKDVFEANIRQDENFYRLFKILASQVGGLTNTNELANTLGISKTAVDNYLLVMQRSYHINLVRPFYRNIRKELTKMPKVYFYDLGLRNFFKSDFRSIVDRDDLGMLLENGVFRQLADTFGADEIRFWRTTAKKEVDLVVERSKMAYEVKIDSKRASLAKYRAFLDSYPEFKLNFVSLKHVLPTLRAGKDRSVILPWQI